MSWASSSCAAPASCSRTGRSRGETAEVLRDGWYRSGDLGYRDSHSYIFLVDRAKDMIVTGGENVYCAEVESALYDHPDVLEAVVFGIPDDRWGEAVHAVVVPREQEFPRTKNCPRTR